MSDHCGMTTEDGNALCIPGECSCSEPNSNQPVILSVPTINNDESLFHQIVVKLTKAKPFSNMLEQKYVEENS